MLRTALPKVNMPLPGPKAQEVIKRRENAMPNAIKCGYPLVISRGEGAMFEDVDGNIILDWVGGVGVLNIGYSHPTLIEAVKEQSEKFFHAMMNITTHEKYIEFAEKINKIAPVKGDEKKTMFVNSGAEADENAVKIARNFTKRPNIIVFDGAFHGRTTLTMTMTANPNYCIDMLPLADGIVRAAFPNLYRAPEGMDEAAVIAQFLDSLKKTIAEVGADTVAGIIFEPVQGEGGFIPAPLEWVKGVRAICDEIGALMITDEVQSGWARSGRMFVSQYYVEAGCAPDIMSTAKSIAGGAPLAAVMARKEIMDAVTPGTIGGTYCGNPLACAAGSELIDIMINEDYPGKANKIAAVCMDRFNKMAEKFDVIGDVRGTGAMMGVEFVTDRATKEPHTKLVADMVSNAVQKGLVLEAAGAKGNVIRFLCPLCVTDEQLNAGLDIFEATLAELV